MENSIYERIKNVIGENGVLPEDFVLRVQPREGMQFADGAVDGTIRYYMGPANNTNIDMLMQALKLASNEKFEDAGNALLTYFAQGVVLLPLLDRVQDWIFAHPAELSPEHLGQFALMLLTKSREVESVKFGLMLLEVLEQEPSENVRELVLTLAVCEELTLYCLFALSTYDDANDLYFMLAKKLKGWGRIHAVSMLKPMNAEMAEWLLQEGWQNNIMPEYSAMTIIKRTKLADRLSGEDGAKLRENAGRLLSYSLADEPVAGIASYKRASELLHNYLQLLHSGAVTAGEKELVTKLKAIAEQSAWANRWTLVDLCNKVLN